MNSPSAFARPEQMTFASEASASARADFIGKTYIHLGGAVLLFAALCSVFLQMGVGERLAVLMTQFGQWGWLIALGLFMLVSWVAESWARSGSSPSVQYAGLGLYVVAESLIFAPLLYIASAFGGPEVLPTAAVLTGIVFAGLTLVVYMTRYNFSFLGPGLAVAGFAILGLFVVSAIFQYNLGSMGIWLPAGLVVFASLYILYHTSNVLHEYQIGQHVAASLALFASVALLFWYMIQLVMRLQSDD